MKLSMFNIEHPVDDGLVLYNTLSSGILFLEKELIFWTITKNTHSESFRRKKDVYIFDETTAYLDKENKVRFFELLNFVSNDSIVIFSSHENLNYIPIKAIDFYI